MWLRKIIIKNCTLSDINDHQSKLDLTIYPLDESNDLEPDIQLKLYINDVLHKTLISNERWEISDSFIIDRNEDEDLNIYLSNTIWDIKSKIRNLFISNIENETQEINHARVENKHQKEETKDSEIEQNINIDWWKIFNELVIKVENNALTDRIIHLEKALLVYSEALLIAKECTIKKNQISSYNDKYTSQQQSFLPNRIKMNNYEKRINILYEEITQLKSTFKNGGLHTINWFVPVDGGSDSETRIQKVIDKTQKEIDILKSKMK